MKQRKYYVHDEAHCSVEYAADEREARRKWANRFGKPQKTAIASCINSPVKEAVKEEGQPFVAV